MARKVVLITGASRGLGYLLAEAMVKEGHIVYSGVRDTQRCPPGSIPVQLDLTDEKTLQKCSQTVLEKHKRVDTLIHNAAIAYWGAVDSMTMEEMRTLFEVNVFGVFRLTQLLLPQMREQRFGRLLFISSIRGVESCAYMGSYAASKAALESMAFDWALSLQKWNIKVSVVQPGPMSTGIEIKHGNYFGEAQNNPYLPYEEPVLTFDPPQQICQAIMTHLNDSNPPFRFQPTSHAQAIVEKHLKDASGQAWFMEQKNWMERSKSSR